MKDGVYIAGEWYPAKGKAVWETDEKKVFPCVPVFEYNKLKMKYENQVIITVKEHQAYKEKVKKAIEELRKPSYINKQMCSMERNAFVLGMSFAKKIIKKELGLSEKTKPEGNSKELPVKNRRLV